MIWSIMANYNITCHIWYKEMLNINKKKVTFADMIWSDENEDEDDDEDEDDNGI